VNFSVTVRQPDTGEAPHKEDSKAIMTTGLNEKLNCPAPI
jgi:hypothetical protein